MLSPSIDCVGSGSATIERASRDMRFGMLRCRHTLCYTRQYRSGGLARRLAGNLGIRPRIPLRMQNHGTVLSKSRLDSALGVK
jgi:hypothetical protein